MGDAAADPRRKPMTTGAVKPNVTQQVRSYGLFWGKTSKLKRQEAIDGFLMALPWMLGFILFTAGPMLAAIYFSLTKWDIISAPKFVGLANFTAMWHEDELFLKSLGVTVRYTLMSVPLHVIFGF